MSILILRKGKKEDYKAYYSHKCEKEDIYWNGFTGAPNKEGLEKVFLSRIENESKDVGTKQIQILEIDGDYVGYIQYTFFDSETEIGIGVSNKHAGKGFGSEGVLLAVEKLKECTIFARIRDDNEISKKCFLKAGFEATELYSEEEYYPLDKPVKLRKYIWKKK